MAVVLTASTQKVHWKMRSMVSRWKSNLLSANLLSRIMLADATQYASPGNTCNGMIWVSHRRDSVVDSVTTHRM